MLTIKSIRFKYSKQLGTQRGKAIRLSFGSTISITKKKPIQLDGQTTEWQQNITIPIFFNRPIDIQIFKPHTFGYNPEQLDSILSCDVRISNYKQNSCESFVYNVNKQKVGQLIVKYQALNQKIILPQDRTKGFLVISSILIHISEFPAQRGYCEFQTGSDAVCTEEINFISNQITSSNEFILKMSPQDFQRMLTVNVITDSELTHKMTVDISKIKTKLFNYRRMAIYNLQKQKAGYAFIDISYRQKNNGQKQKKFEKQRQKLRLNSISSPLLPMLQGNKKFNNASTDRYSPVLLVKPQSFSANRFRPNSKSHKLLSKAEQITQQKTRKKLYSRLNYLDYDYQVKIFDIGDESIKKKLKDRQIGSNRQKHDKHQVKEHPVNLPRPIDFSRFRMHQQ